MENNNYRLVELSKIELQEIEGGSHIKSFFEGFLCGLGVTAFLMGLPIP